MARDITQCKEMIKYAKDKGVLLSIGHQRHYSTLYAQALEVLNSGVLGDIKHIRALWHRNNSWPYPPRDADKAKNCDRSTACRTTCDSWWKEVPQGGRRRPFRRTKLKPNSAFGNPDEVWLRGHRRTGPLAALRQDRRRPHGRTRQPPARRRPRSSSGTSTRSPFRASAGSSSTAPAATTARATTACSSPSSSPARTTRRPARAARTRATSSSSPTPRSTPTSSRSTASGSWAAKGTMFLEKEAERLPVQGEGQDQEGRRRPAGGRDTKITVTRPAAASPAMEATSTWGGGGAAASTGKAAGRPGGTPPSAATAPRWSTSPTACASGRSGSRR